MKIIKWVEASAGTGKTTKILSSINRLVNSGVDPESILCLSFTKASASEMMRRYTHGGCKFDTIHGFANSLIQDDLKLITEEVIVNSLIKEAIELSINDEWVEFLGYLDYDWVNVVDHVKHIISIGLTDNNDMNLKTKASSDEKIDFEVILSKKAQSDLVKANMSKLLDYILSADVNVYMKHLITKEFQINRRTVSESAISNLAYETANEVREVLKNILNFCVAVHNQEYLKITATFNMFLSDVLKNYSLIKEQRGYIDYNDIILNGTKNPLVHKIMNIKHVFLDEAQDTSIAQWNFVFNLLNEVLQHEECSFIAVGDPKQIIFEFNGASHNLFEIVKVKLKDIARIHDAFWSEEALNTCYRCPQVILDFVDILMSRTKYSTKHIAGFKNKKGYIKTWLPNSDAVQDTEKPEWHIDHSFSVPAKIQLCIDEIIALKNTKLLNKDRLVEYSDIMILIPKRCGQTFLLAHKLKEAGIPIRESPFYINQDDMIREFLAIGEFIFNPDDDVPIVSVVKGPFFAWSNEELESVCCGREKSIWNTMCASENKKIKSTVRNIQKWLEFPKDSKGFYSNLFFHTEYGKYVMNHFHNEVLILWETVLQFAQTSTNLFDFIEAMQSSKKTYKTNTNGVIISTIHGAKGSEAPIVFLFNVNTSMVRNSSLNLVQNKMLLIKGNYKVYKNAKNKNMFDQEIEAERLMYVAMTRSEEQIYILPADSYDNIAPKSLYSLVIKEIDSFDKINDFEYEISDCQKLQKIPSQINSSQ